MTTPKRFKWTVEFSVDASWVADGFDLDDDRAKDMLNHDLTGAYGHEIGAKVLKAPDPARIMRVQGYTEAEIAKKCGGSAILTK